MAKRTMRIIDKAIKTCDATYIVFDQNGRPVGGSTSNENEAIKRAIEGSKKTGGRWSVMNFEGRSTEYYENGKMQVFKQGGAQFTHKSMY